MSDDNVAQEPVAWRWKPKGGSVWIYDPDPEWLAKQSRDEIDAEPVYALPAAPVVAGLREALAIAESRYRDNGEGFGIIEAIREALFTALRAAPEGVDAQQGET